MKSSKYQALLLLASVAATGAAAEDNVAGGGSPPVPAPNSTTASRFQGATPLDFANAKAMPLPRPPAAPDLAELAKLPAVAFGAAGFSAGGQGNGIQNPVKITAPKFIGEAATPIPQEFGTGGIPYTTSRVNAYNNNTQSFYPFRAAGKLFFNIGSSTFVCSASLIKPGVIVTAAHCVAEFGARRFYSGWQFIPAYNNGVAPYGVYTAQVARVLTKYFDGTDSCAVSGVVCQDDVAVIRLNKVNSLFPGQRVGWLGYGVNGFGFTSTNKALITQLGYPVALDSGGLQERTDSQGQIAPSQSNNTVIGSLQTGGSSGGPWAANLGFPPVLSGIAFGSEAAHNAVVGVTSWGFTDKTIKLQGASPFTTVNIGALVTAICTGAPAGSC